jgi:amino acid transporter
MMARHGLFHASLGAAHRSNLTPHIAIGICAIATFTIPTAMNLFGIKPFESMGYTGTICSFGFLLVYILVSIAAPVYLYRLGKLRPKDIAFSVLAVGFMAIPIVGTLGIPGSDLFPVPAFPQNIFPYLFLLYLAAGFGWYVIQRVRSPKMMHRMQHSIDAIHARFKD